MSDEPDIIPPEAFGVASWLVLRAILASTPELHATELSDRVLLSLERLQAGEPDDEYVAGLYRDARRLVEAALRTHSETSGQP